MSHRFLVQNASYRAWIAPDNTLQQQRPVVAGEEKTAPFGEGDMTEWVRLCRAGYVYVCFGPISTMFLYGRPSDLIRAKKQWQALGSAVARVLVTLVGDGKVDFVDAAEFELPDHFTDLEGFIRENS